MKSSTAFIGTFVILNIVFWTTMGVFPKQCVLPSSNLSKDAIILGIAQGCEIDVSKDPMVKDFSNLTKSSRFSSEELERLDIKSWIRFVKAQAQLNDTLEYARERVISPSQILYRSIEDSRSPKALAIIYASSYCSDGGESGTYEDMISSFVDKSPETNEQAVSMAFYAVQEMGCL